jgi:hypothetical protein
MQQCKICGCTDENPCVTAAGTCSWAMTNLCTECLVVLKHGEHCYLDFTGDLLIEKRCRNCAKLAEDKEAEEMGYKNCWRCLAGRYDHKVPGGDTVPGCYAWGGICRPNKAVAAAQRKCPFFEVHPKWRRHEN